MLSWKLVIVAGSTRMPLTGICLKLQSLDPSNCDPDQEEDLKKKKNAATAVLLHNMNLVDSVIHVIHLLEVKIGVHNYMIMGRIVLNL
jgi:hypothetical protein